jgi:cyanophycinase
MAQRRHGSWLFWRGLAALGTLLLALAGPLAATAAPPHTLVPVGGGYTKTSLEGFARAVMSHAHGTTVNMLVVPSAYGDSLADRQANLRLAGKRAKEIESACKTIVQPPFTGCTATLLVLLDRADALDPANSALFNSPDTDGAFILGGDQDIAMEVLANTPAETAMNDAYQRGVVFGGTSAGNAVESATMLAGFTDNGYPENALEQNTVIIWWADGPDPAQRGLVFGSRSMVFDQHFYQRGRFGRLLNVVAQSDEHFGGQSLLGLGVDYATGVSVTNDNYLDTLFGDSSVALIDYETLQAAHTWVGPNQTLSARNVLTQIIAPTTGLTYDVTARRPLVNGQPIPPPQTPGWSPALLRAPGQATLILGGDLSGDWQGPAIREFLSRASGGQRLVIVSANAGDKATADAYTAGLQQAGWTGQIDTLVYGNGSQWSRTTPQTLDGAAGVVFVAADQSQLAAPLADARFRALVGAAVANTPVVLTDHAMTAALGSWYVANPEPTSANVQDMAIAAFRTGDANVQPGLGLLPGVAFEPRLTRDQRWGRLYGLALAHPDTIVFGLSEMTALVLDNTAASAQVIGQRSVIALDSRAATYSTGSNGAFSALNVVLDIFGPGDLVQPAR